MGKTTVKGEINGFLFFGTVRRRGRLVAAIRSQLDCFKLTANLIGHGRTDLQFVPVESVLTDYGGS